MDVNEFPVTPSPSQEQASSVGDPHPEAPVSLPVRASLIKLSYDESTRLVEAQLVPSHEARPCNIHQLRAMLRDQGLGDLYTADASLEAVVQRANHAEAGVYVVAERRDAAVEWQVSDDKRAVYLTLHKAWGGATVSRERLLQELTDLSVPTRCISYSALDEVLSQGQADRRLIAKAVLPEPGRDSIFESLIKAVRQVAMQEDKTGRVDMHQLHDFVVVEIGEPLMRRIPPTPGTAGVDVVGEPLPAVPGKEVPFDKDCSGAEPDPQDANVLRAAIKGHPVILRQGVRVDPALRVKNVDLTTGNIDFDGSVEVQGNISSGFTLRATGDVVVRGMVEKAVVTAGRDLLINGGVLGENLGRDPEGQLNLVTRLRAGQNFSAKYINLAKVTAGVDLVVREYALQSQLVAGRDLRLGQPTGKGSLIGGHAKAGRAVIANILGSEASVAGEVMVGRLPCKRKLLASLREELTLCEFNIRKLNEALRALIQGPHTKASEDKVNRIRRAQLSLQKRHRRLKALVDRISARLDAASEARVEVKRKLYANVSICIDGVCLIYHGDHGPSHLVRMGTEIISHP